MTNFVNNIPDMKQRLIDANALSQSLEDQRKALDIQPYGEFQSGVIAGINAALSTIRNAPTVETTDDVLTRIGRHPTVFFGNDEWNAYVMQNLNKVCNGKTPLEAVKKLEASLNPK